MQICVYFLPLYIFFTISGGKCLRLVLGENDVLALLYFVKICGLYVRKKASVDMGYIHGSMDIHGYIHGYPRKICGYGYGWKISYPRQAWKKLLKEYKENDT